LSDLPRFAVDNSEFAPEQLLVRFQDGVPVETGGRVEAISPGLYLLQLNADESVADARASFRARADVQYAEPDYIVHADLTPNDPRFTEMWGLNNTGQSGGTRGADIGAPAAWDVSVGSGNTVVAMIDTGIDYTHP